MNTQLNLRSLGTALLASSLAVLAGCSMMNSGKEEEHGGVRSTVAAVGRMEAVTLSGANEVPPVMTSAAGSGSVTVGRDRAVKASIRVTGINATAAHIHIGAMGANGPVAVPLVKQGDDTFVAPDGARMTEEQYDAWKAGRTYVNVHSAANPGGELRAQLKGDK